MRISKQFTLFFYSCIAVAAASIFPFSKVAVLLLLPFAAVMAINGISG
jgi:hypothetical protein